MNRQKVIAMQAKLLITGAEVVNQLSEILTRIIQTYPHIYEESTTQEQLNMIEELRINYEALRKITIEEVNK